MRIYVGFDDTDNLEADRGTGKVARWFEDRLPDGYRMEGVLRQQLLVHEDIPYTSHNSAACMIVHAPDTTFLETLVAEAVSHLEMHALEGSDPGLCVVCEGAPSLLGLMEFGRECTRRIVSQREAMKAAFAAHLSGHGGTNDGIIGAAAAVGLTASGWNGRFIEYGRLRHFHELVMVSDLERSGMMVVSIDRDARVPAPNDLVNTKGWLRPRLWGGRAVVLVSPKKEGRWEAAGEKRPKERQAREASTAFSKAAATYSPLPAFHNGRRRP